MTSHTLVTLSAETHQVIARRERERREWLDRQRQVERLNVKARRLAESGFGWEDIFARLKLPKKSKRRRKCYMTEAIARDAVFGRGK